MVFFRPVAFGEVAAGEMQFLAPVDGGVIDCRIGGRSLSPASVVASPRAARDRDGCVD
jgi:hypothetical protein